MTTIHHYSRSHQRRAVPPAHAAQPLRHRPRVADPVPFLIPVIAEQAAPAEIPVTVAIPLPALNPDNPEPQVRHIPSPLLPPKPTPGPTLRDRIRDAYDRLAGGIRTRDRARRPAPAPALEPTYTATAWALR